MSKDSWPSKKATNDANGNSDHLTTDSPKGTSASAARHPTTTDKKTKVFESPSTSALIICRNKYSSFLDHLYETLQVVSIGRHWRYISAFHGPWLQLPPEILESLAYGNYTSPRPHPIDPAVFADLIEIRRLVEEATELAVRATNGTTSASMRSASHAGNGYGGGAGGGAAAFGLGFVGPSHVKLSRERKHRMRELATQKLSRAYQLDEIAASVATMQSTSSLEEVAKIVLQRNPNNSDAKYVHFFHEKIPSRMLDESTSLEPLNDLIHHRPTDSVLLRTRAVTKIFKHDLRGAAEDLTESLAMARYIASQRRKRQSLESSNSLAPAENAARYPRDGPPGSTRSGEEQPDSLEPQLLFQRGGVYLTLACEGISSSLQGKELQGPLCKETELSQSPCFSEQLPRHEVQKSVKMYAKRALRDYVNFLSFFEYTSGLSTENFHTNVLSGSEEHSPKRGALSQAGGLPRFSGGDASEELRSSDAVSPYKIKIGDSSCSHGYAGQYSHPQPPKSIPVSMLFSSTPPTDLSPYPVTSQELVKAGSKQSATRSNEHLDHELFSQQSREAITYHPLLTESLHALLLCHTLAQTSPKELLRHAHMVARLVRLCDGYPIFLAARSPSRADWIDVIRQTDNWIGLEHPWESLCAPPPPPGSSKDRGQQSQQQAQESRWHEAVMESLADERVQDEESFQAAVTAREKRAKDLEKVGPATTGSKAWARRESTEYAIGTERAEAIARWVLEAPNSIPGSGRAKRGKKKAKAPSNIRSDPLQDVTLEEKSLDKALEGFSGHGVIGGL
ncbi:MAG: hypothetical protein Q9174_002803 [Haloplaca sp. 1 TL-2023]